MNNLELYNKVRNVPQEAQKLIKGGRLKGMTDINPIWRIKTLTEQFGRAGEGWYYRITDHWTEDGVDGEKCVFVNIELFTKTGNNTWSAPIQGTGGSKLVMKEWKGLYTNDECYKMALTDAISVACKALGFGADIYWQTDRDKYNTVPADKATAQTPKEQPQKIDEVKEKTLLGKLKELKSISEKHCWRCYSEITNNGETALNELTPAEWAKYLKMVETTIAEVKNAIKKAQTETAVGRNEQQAV